MMWFTESFDNFLVSQMVLSNNTHMFNIWKKPPVDVIYNVYIFNYTNVEDFRDGLAEKLHLEEVGPYAYEEHLERVDLEFPTHNSISYKEKRNFVFKPELSKGRQNDQLIVPNVAVINAAAFTKKQSYFQRVVFAHMLTGMDEKPFLTIAADSFITGYTDRLQDLSRKVMPDIVPKLGVLGVLAPKIGQTPYRITINNGKDDIDNLGIVEKFNGKTELDYFAGGQCNSINSTDGTIFPPRKVQKKEPLHYLLPEGCRRFPLVFNSETTVLDGKVPVYQYVHPEDLFDSADEKPENGCFCMDSGQCPLKGVYNASSCNYGSPVFLSHPHFHRADPNLTKNFTGLHPERDFKSYVNLHPTFGFAISARKMMQVNIQVQKVQEISQVDMFEDGMLLPIAYVEAVLDDKSIPQDIVDIIYLASFTVPSIKLALQYGSLLTAIITMILLILMLRRKSSSKVLPAKLLRSN
ncbi:scavenger receptor class B member 1-like isoform X2 [Diabrotica virgifera virgifera]|nr:scavenger receptor class B member 1-like isoform X2 [Diabrotica virgifera virgifera]XP_050506429.1 scavenger receptor class B member 1-like isoform X2 [Diabrotica virgifera virgifera]